MFLTYLFDNISVEAIGFSYEAIGKMATSVFYVFLLETSCDHLLNVVPYGYSSPEMRKKTSQICRLLGEYLENVSSFIAQSQPYKETMENRASEILLIPG